MSTSSSDSSELRKRLVQQIHEMYPGVLAISPEQFAALVGKNRVWGYRRIWAKDVKALGAEDKLGAQQYQILIEEVAEYFVSKSKEISIRRDRQNAPPGGKMAKYSGKRAMESGKSRAAVYQVTLLDLAEKSVLIQFVCANSGMDAGNYALSFDETGEAREEGYGVVTVISRKDISALSQEARKIGTGVVPSVKPKGDRTWFQDSLISD